ncbi:MAG: response regulator receiver protein [Pedosphaera sp.]|nr:response regulator receiver protein [Pedosphaera sp.]
MKTDRLILLVEENFDEVFVLERAFHEAMIVNPVHIARHVEEAICYMEGVGVYADRERYPLPSLILLSMKAGTRVGFRLLMWIRSNDRFGSLPVVALGSGKNILEVGEAFRLGANAYFERRTDAADIIRLIQGIEMVEDIWVPTN